MSAPQVTGQSPLIVHPVRSDPGRKDAAARPTAPPRWDYGLDKQQRRVRRFAVRLTLEHDGDPLMATDAELAAAFHGCVRPAPVGLYPAIRVEARQLIDDGEVRRRLPVDASTSGQAVQLPETMLPEEMKRR